MFAGKSIGLYFAEHKGATISAYDRLRVVGKENDKILDRKT